MNKDLIYILCSLLIIVNIIMSNKNEFPFYINSNYFNILFLLLIVIILLSDKNNIYFGLFLSITYLIVNSKRNN